MGLATAAVGITPRSSSAVLVTIAGSPDGPRVLDRRRFELVEADVPAQAYHAAATLELSAAEALVHRWERAAVAASARNLADAVEHAAGQGARVVAVGIVGSVRELPPLPSVLRSHALLHAAEGQLSREVVAEAAAAAGLPVHFLEPGGPHDELTVQRSAALGGAVGPPWRKEHKLAAVAALTALPTGRGSAR